MKSDDLTADAVELAKIYLANNVMPFEKVPALIRDIHKTLLELSGARKTASEGEVELEYLEVSGASSKVAPILHNELDDPVFKGLDPWLARRVNIKMAGKLNPKSKIHPTVFPDHLVCLEDGKEVILLRPYIQKRFGLSLAEYIDKWNLPDNYPAAPSSYIKAKREAAKAHGLGVRTRAKRERKSTKANAPN